MLTWDPMVLPTSVYVGTVTTTFIIVLLIIWLSNRR